MPPNCPSTATLTVTESLGVDGKKNAIRFIDWRKSSARSYKRHLRGTKKYHVMVVRFKMMRMYGINCLLLILYTITL